MFLTRHYQNAYVTADIERAVAIMRDQYGVADVTSFEVTQPLWTARTGSGDAKMKLALFMVGNLQIELIEPVSGAVDLYREGIVADRPFSFHHVSMRVDDLDAVEKESVRLNRPVAQRGESGPLRFLYADARETLGHYLEYVSAPPEYWTFLPQG
jgi:hypothetical protein